MVQYLERINFAAQASNPEAAGIIHLILYRHPLNNHFSKDDKVRMNGSSMPPSKEYATTSEQSAQ
ncbi:MAG: hypothetical protein VCE74_18845 [Alphaproteobacteria bacterium]|jgi:hypothetical protein